MRQPAQKKKNVQTFSGDSNAGTCEERLINLWLGDNHSKVQQLLHILPGFCWSLEAPALRSKVAQRKEI